MLQAPTRLDPKDMNSIFSEWSSPNAGATAAGPSGAGNNDNSDHGHGSGLTLEEACDLDALAANLDCAESLWAELGLAENTDVTSSSSDDSVKAETVKVEEVEVKPCSPDSGIPDHHVCDNLDSFNSMDLDELLPGIDGVIGSAAVGSEVTAAASAVSTDEPFSFSNDQAMQGLENGGRPEDTIKSDCMWSSSLDFIKSTSARNRHSKSHSGLKPFTCFYCDYASDRKSSLKIHCVKKHEMTGDEFKARARAKFGVAVAPRKT